MNIKLWGCVCLFVCCLSPVLSWAQTDTVQLKLLEKEMYRLYATDSTDRFFEVTDRLKSLALQADDDRLFYKTWSNQALFYTTHSNRRKGLEVIWEVRDYAMEHENKYGLFASTYVNATLLSAQHIEDQAEKMFLRALDYQHQYFPEESAAATYLGLAKIYVNQHKNDDVLECARKALAEPGVIPLHQLSAWSYRCIALGMEGKNDREGFNHAYAERQKVKEKFGIDDSFGHYVDTEYAEINGRYQEMLEEATQMRKGIDRLNMLSRAYAHLGDYKHAYQYAREHKRYSDSVNTSEIILQAAETALALDLMRAENETKSLRLANQSIYIRMAAVLIAFVLASLGFYIYRRRKQISRLREAYDKLEETTIEKERFESELRIAHNIQMEMVTADFPAFPDRNDIDLHALMMPAREVGGDLYDFLLQDDKLYFCVGDVSGKGVPASMTMMVVINLFRTFVKDGIPPVSIVKRLNETLSVENESCIFVTMFVGAIDLKTGGMDFCNAGHNPPVMIDVQHPQFMEVESNVPIGLWPEMEFVQEHVDNIKGKQLLIYTDGLTEAENMWQEQFGEAHLLEVLKWNRFKSARQTIELLQREVKRHVGGAEQSDDLCMLCIRILQVEPTFIRELTIDNDINELHRVTSFMDGIGTELHIDHETLHDLQLALEEVVSNVIFYAHPTGSQDHIVLTAQSHGRELCLTIKDYGPAFDPTKKPDVDINVNPADRRTGGLGIYIVKKIMDEVSYQRTGNCNLLAMRKVL